MSVENSQTFRVNPKPDSSFDFVVKEQVSTTESFPDQAAAQSEYSQRLDKLKKDIRYQEFKQGLVVLGGFLGGIGVAVIARSNELSLGSPNTYIGVDLLAGGMYLAHSGLAAIGKEEEFRTLYEQTRKRWEHIRVWAEKRNLSARNLYKAKEEVVFNPKAPADEEILALSSADSSLVHENVTPNPLGNTKEPGHILSKKIKSAMSAANNISDKKDENAGIQNSSVEESSAAILPSEEKHLEEEVVDIKEPDKSGVMTKTSVKDTLRHYRWREQVIRRERKFLKEAGIIPEHKCHKKECVICAGYDPIFL